MLKKSLLLGMIGAAFLVLAGAPVAKADSFTLYCTGGNTCFTSNTGLTAYWTLASNITLTSGTFDYTLQVSETGETHPGYINDFSGQFFFGSGASVTGLTWVKNPGGWPTPQESKAGNNGTCNGSTNGAFCGSDNAGTAETTALLLGSSPTTFEVKGSYTGTYLSSGTWNFQAAASTNSDDSGGNVFAVSQSVGATTTVPTPEPGTFSLLGVGLLGLVGLGMSRRSLVRS